MIDRPVADGGELTTVGSRYRKRAGIYHLSIPPSVLASAFSRKLEDMSTATPFHVLP
jgi:hypothetical protein